MWYEIAFPAIACLISIFAIIISINSRNNEKMKDINEKIEQKADKQYVEKQIDMLRMDLNKTIIRIDNNLAEIRSYILNLKN